MKKIFIGYTQYQLLIFLLLKEKNDKITFILPKYLERLKNNFNEKYEIKVFDLEKPSLKSIKRYIIYCLGLKKFIKTLNITEDTILYGDNIINYLVSNKNLLYKIEDGTGNYNSKLYEEQLVSFKVKLYFIIENIIFLIIFRKRLLTEKEKLKKRVNKYYATEIAPLNLWFENITERINLKKLWDEKTEIEKEEILNIFGVTKKLLFEFDKKMILFTQPLSEDGIITEEKKIDLYKKILKNYDEEKIMIKPHPREKTKYATIFKKCKVIEENFPSEILKLMGIKIERAITMFSTAALHFDKDIKIDFYGTEIDKTIFETFGSQDEIMKRNAFLD